MILLKEGYVGQVCDSTMLNSSNHAKGIKGKTSLMQERFFCWGMFYVSYVSRGCFVPRNDTYYFLVCEYVAGHFLGDGDAHVFQYGWGEVAELAGVQGAVVIVANKEEWHGVQGVGGVGAAIGVNEVVGIAMVGGEEDGVAVLQGQGHDAGHAGIYGLYRFYDGGPNAGVAYHIGIGKVEADEVGSFGRYLR